MKTNKAILLTLTTLLLPLGMPSVQADDVFGPADFVDYQGTVYDSATQKPLGTEADGVTAKPTNYTMYFKVFSDATGGDLVWAESQTVTVNKGAFSVRLGLGAVIANLTTLETNIADAFKGKVRYLEMTVLPLGQTTGGAVISPRLAFQSSPYAFVAGQAKSVVGGVFAGTIDSSGGTFNGGIFNDAVFGGTKTIFNQPVGIGVNDPVTKLQIRGGADASYSSHGYMVLGDVAGTNLVLDNNEIVARSNGGPSDLLLQKDGGNIYMIQEGSGNVGIGTSSPQAKLHVKGYKSLNFYREAWLNKDGAFDSDGNKSNYPMSIKASNRILADAFDVTSDARIKVIAGISNTQKDLETLQKIEITDYHFKDTVSKGKGHYKKVIAQQVEKVFPMAISQDVGVVPNIYKMSTCKDGWVLIQTDLKVGEKVRLMVDGKNADLYEVVEVAENGFRVSSELKDGDLFVYGRQVDDFRSVDYDAIAMLNVSATQQLKKEKDAEVRALRSEIEQLKSKLESKERVISGMKTRGDARDARLEAVERWIRSSRNKEELKEVPARVVRAVE